MKKIIKTALGPRAAKWLKWKINRMRSPVIWGNLKTLNPKSRFFGFDRGTPIDRFYIESFMQKNRHHILGKVSEVAEDIYSSRYASKPIELVLTHVENRPNCRKVNYENGEGVQHKEFNCIILTQVLPFIFDFESAIKNIKNSLAPGGVLLITVSGINSISEYDNERWGDYWRFTEKSLNRLLGKFFGNENVEVVTFGNLLAATALLHGITSEEVSQKNLSFNDGKFPVIIAATAKNV